MRRSALIATAAVVLGLGLAACGNETEREALPEEVVGTVPAEPAEEPAPSEGEEPAPSEGEEPAEGAADPANGAEVFAAAGCGSCHVLEAAGSTGAVGPNLDESQPDLALVIDRVTNGAGAMPAFAGQLSEQEIADVSAYVVESTSG